MKIKTIIIAVLVLLFIIILLQNKHTVPFHLLFWDMEIPMYYIPVFFVISPVAGYFIAKYIDSRDSGK